MIKAVSVSFTLFLFIFIVGLESVMACKCKSSNSPCAVFNGADAVFIGIAKEIVKSANPYGINIKLSVDESFKGTNLKEEIVSSEGVCDATFHVGKTYLVYAKRDKANNQLNVRLCSRTTLLEYAAQELEFIRLLAAGKPVSSIYGKVEQRTNKENPP